MAKRNLVALFVACVLASAFLTGCFDVTEPFTHYKEEETPPGGPVPPPPESVRPAEVRRDTPPAVTSESPAETAQQTIKDFAKQYASNGSPRVVVFLNRNLSDEVREWRGVERVVVSGEGERVSASKATVLPLPNMPVAAVPGAAGRDPHEGMVMAGVPGNVVSSGADVEGSEDKERSMTAQTQEYLEEEERAEPDEAWVWALEEGMLEPFLQAKANVIDRATIMRLAAAESTVGGKSQVVSPKQIEMSALKNHADLFIEVLITRSASSLYGYEFKASVKEVETGKILANVTSVDWRGKGRLSPVVFADSEVQRLRRRVILPAVKDVSHRLAIDVMKALMHAWGE